jgi:hypothetical protein
VVLAATRGEQRRWRQVNKAGTTMFPVYKTLRPFIGVVMLETSTGQHNLPWQPRHALSLRIPP